MTAPVRRDEGSALVITMMVVTLVMVLTTTIMSVTVNDLGSSRRARDAGAAVDAADAGIAQALAYLRAEGPHRLRCSPDCPANAWGNKDAPVIATLPGLGNQQYRVWIEPIAKFPENDPGRYRIHSLGTVGAGGGADAARRDVELDVYLGSRGTGVPLGLFGRTLQGAGDYTLARASIFSTGCVYNRARIAFTAETDAAYGIPTGVHSAKTITESNGNNGSCGETHTSIHEASDGSPAPCGPVKQPGNELRFRHDQDSSGRSLLGTACESVQTGHPRYYGKHDLDGDGDIDVDGSWLQDEDALLTLFGIAEEPFTPAQLDELRMIARSQGSWYATAAGFGTPDPAVHPHSVLFFDLLGTPAEGDTVDLSGLGSAWARSENLSADSPDCKPRSLLIVVSGGNVKLNSNHRMAASVVLTSTSPYGKVVKHNGTAELIGTVYGDYVDLAGTADLSLDSCFISNLSPTLLGVETRRYRELDRG